MRREMRRWEGAFAALRHCSGRAELQSKPERAGRGRPGGPALPNEPLLLQRQRFGRRDVDGIVGLLRHAVDVLEAGHASAVLAASLFHFGTLTIPQVKEFLAKSGVPVRR